MHSRAFLDLPRCPQLAHMPVMRIAVLSDIHGNLAALMAVVEDIKHRSVDAVVNLGDSLSGPLLPRETAQFLMALNWTHLAGNHERQILELGPHSSESDIYAHSQLGVSELSWIASLPHTRRFGQDVLLCHGSPTSDETSLLEVAERSASATEIAARLGETDAALILCGQTHVPRAVRSMGRLIVNPGSVGQPAYADDVPHPHVIESGSPDARYALLERRNGYWQPNLVSVPYDPEGMAALAASRGRLDWAHALRTGYIS
jgi:putative phosphoesterase